VFCSVQTGCGAHPPPGQGGTGGLLSHEADNLPVTSADGKK